MERVELADARWRKSARSGSGNNCVEVAILSTCVAVRDTKDNGKGSVLVFTPTEWDAFVAGVKDGEFDQH